MYYSDPVEESDRIVKDYSNKADAVRFAQKANARIIADHGIPKVGRPLPLYYVYVAKGNDDHGDHGDHGDAE